MVAVSVAGAVVGGSVVALVRSCVTRVAGGAGLVGPKGTGVGVAECSVGADAFWAAGPRGGAPSAGGAFWVAESRRASSAATDAAELVAEVAGALSASDEGTVASVEGSAELSVTDSVSTVSSRSAMTIVNILDICQLLTIRRVRNYIPDLSWRVMPALTSLSTSRPHP